MPRRENLFDNLLGLYAFRNVREKKSPFRRHTLLRFNVSGWVLDFRGNPAADYVERVTGVTNGIIMRGRTPRRDTQRLPELIECTN